MLLLSRDSRQEVDHLLLAADVQVGERLVEEQQSRMADQRVGDEDALLLAAGEVADARIRETHRVDGVEHLVDLLATRWRRQRQTEPLPVDAEADEVARAQRHVRIERDPLRARSRSAAGAAIRSRHARCPRSA